MGVLVALLVPLGVGAAGNTYLYELATVLNVLVSIRIT